MKPILQMTEEEFAAAFPHVDEARRTLGLTWRGYRNRLIAEAAMESCFSWNSTALPPVWCSTCGRAIAVYASGPGRHCPYCGGNNIQNILPTTIMQEAK